MNLLNNLILMVVGFDLLVAYLIYKAMIYYRNN